MRPKIEQDDKEKLKKMERAGDMNAVSKTFAVELHNYNPKQEQLLSKQMTTSQCTTRGLVVRLKGKKLDEETLQQIMWRVAKLSQRMKIHKDNHKDDAQYKEEEKEREDQIFQ